MITAMYTTLTTTKLAEVRAFYERHFQATAVFDCGWYVSLQLGSTDATVLSLMEPRDGALAFQGGLTLNLKVPDVNATYAALVERDGLVPVMALEDHPWGDRGFVVLDPIGTRLYCYHEIPMSPEYQAVLRMPTEP